MRIAQETITYLAMPSHTRLGNPVLEEIMEVREKQNVGTIFDETTIQVTQW